MILKKYNHTDSVLFLEELGTARLSLLNAVNFDPTHVSMLAVTQSGSLEHYGNGWLQGGMPVNAWVETVGSHVELKTEGVQVRAAGGAIGPAIACVLHVNNKPFIFCDFEGEKFTIDNHYFSITWADRTILRSI